jgi:hypothetical protein
VERLNKDTVVNALNAIQSGQDPDDFHDELEVAIGVLMETGDDLIAKVVADIHEDAENTDPK